ncbi:hypothetical protein GGG16DRAFT_111596 [Schizophyllum commune]|nr:hypothetical protein K525DRAFT_273083 [Schizophyllum commune Loenen D]
MVRKPMSTGAKRPPVSPTARKRPLKRPEAPNTLKRKADASGNPRLAKARRTHKNGISNAARAHPITADSEGPSLQEWRAMSINNKLIITDYDNNPHEFIRGEFVQILPSDVDPDDIPELEDSEFWVGCIRDMRHRKVEGGDPDVWVQVQWLYSPDDVLALRANEIKVKPKEPYRNVSRFSPYERFWSTHKDIIPSACLNDVVRVYNFSEADIDAPPIPPETFFIRYDLDTQTGNFKPTPKNKAAHNCACDTPYNTGDPNERLRFCPRPACRRAFHESCLDPYPTAGITDLHALFLSSHPHKNHPVDLRGEPRDIRPISGLGKGKGKGKGKAMYDAVGAETQEVAELLPERLLALAGRPIVRGGGRGGGVTGNVYAVCRARLKVYEIAFNGLPDDSWEDEFEDELDELDEEGDEELTVYQCPRCVGPI